MGAEEITAFPQHLCVKRKVAAATHNQALNALVFLYREVLKVELIGIEKSRSHRPKRLPVVLTVPECKALLGAMSGMEGLMARLLYGCGLRVAECLRLRIKDVDLAGRVLTVRGGKGDKDRIIELPERLGRYSRSHRRLHRRHPRHRPRGPASPHHPELRRRSPADQSGRHHHEGAGSGEDPGADGGVKREELGHS
jgi:integrase